MTEDWQERAWQEQVTHSLDNLGRFVEGTNSALEQVNAGFGAQAKALAEAVRQTNAALAAKDKRLAELEARLEAVEARSVKSVRDIVRDSRGEIAQIIEHTAV